MYKDDFKAFVKKGVECKYHVGSGNPNAQILYIGKESAIADNNHKGRKWYNENANDWQHHIDNYTCEILSFPIPEDHVFRIEKNWGKNTWSKYQKLTDRIFEKEGKPYHIDFLENIFTTEINDAPSKNTSKADKSKLNERKLLFKESDFIQNFPVIVLACSNYIKNNSGLREIDEIFGVKYEDEFPRKVYNKTNWFFSHFNENRTKMVIHTRQLSSDVKTDLLNDMGDVIREHLKKLSK
jgi:hypothetical protein